MAEYHSWNTVCLKNAFGAAMGICIGFTLIPFISFFGNLGWALAIAFVSLTLICFAIDHFAFGLMKSLRKNNHRSLDAKEYPIYASPVLLVAAIFVGVLVWLSAHIIQSGAA